jgi:hypothetical protein
MEAMKATILFVLSVFAATIAAWVMVFAYAPEATIKVDPDGTKSITIWHSLSGKCNK